MASRAYCPTCGASFPHNRNSCEVCGEENTSIKPNPAYDSLSDVREKAVVFDINMTLLDTSERHRSAIRAGLEDKNGNAVKKTAIEPLSKAQNRLNDFLHEDKHLSKDTVVPGAKTLVDHFAADGYTIVYCTNRPMKYKEATRRQLESKNFPIYTDRKGDPLLFLRSGKGSKHTYKRDIFVELRANYDVHYVFDDSNKVLNEAAQLGIPGLYTTVRAYLDIIKPSSVKKNPIEHDKEGKPFVLGEVDPEKATKELAEHYDKEDNNPPEDDEDDGEIERVEAMRVTGRPQHHRISMETEDWQKMLAEQGYTNPKDVLPIYSGEPKKQFKNLGIVTSQVQIGRNIFMDIGEGIQDIYRSLIGGRQSMTEKRMTMAVAVMEKELSERATALGGNALVNLKIDYEFPFSGGRSSDITLVATADAIKMRSPKKAKATSANTRMYKNVPITKVEGGYVTPKLTKPQPMKAKKHKTLKAARAYIDKVHNTRKNPANPSKVEKGKKLYEHMNKVKPEKIETKQIDIGDVWYQVGEGGCWQIGYMSGKETNKKDQKYTHTFNEETKDGNFPKLYATIPDKGKPMLIITGGTWKIKTDDTNTAWIYD